MRATSRMRITIGGLHRAVKTNTPTRWDELRSQESGKKRIMMAAERATKMPVTKAWKYRRRVGLPMGRCPFVVGTTEP